jgi:type I restriction-modification system DNA methylase subunit
MSIEEVVIELAECLNHAGLNEGKISERELFLCLMATILINKIENGRYKKILNTVYQSAQNGQYFREINHVVQDAKYTTESHQRIFSELSERLNKIPGTKLGLLQTKTEYLITYKPLDNISAESAVKIYSHVLQRLQSMNVADKLSAEFQYHNLPFELSELISALANKQKPHDIYDPFANTGDLAAHYALSGNVNLVTVESELQTSSYINHMLCISGVKNLKVMHSFSLSPYANVVGQSFDVAFSLLEPKPSIETKNDKIKISTETLNDIEDGRIDSETVKLKFREHAFIRQTLYSLKPDGVAVVLVGKGPLQRARSILLEQNVVDAVIELPAKLITSRTVTLYALVLRQNREDKKVKFIDASDCFKAVGRINQLSDLETITKRYNSKRSIAGRVVIKSVTDIISNECALVPSNYLPEHQIVSRSINIELTRRELLAQILKTDICISKIQENMTNVLSS